MACFQELRNFNCEIKDCFSSWWRACQKARSEQWKVQIYEKQSTKLQFSTHWSFFSLFFFICRYSEDSEMPVPTSGAAVPPPDGGWGWAVVLGSFISIGFSYAFPKAITVFFKDIQIIFDASYSQVAWISSIMLAVMYAAGKQSWKRFSKT